MRLLNLPFALTHPKQSRHAELSDSTSHTHHKPGLGEGGREKNERET